MQDVRALQVADYEEITVSTAAVGLTAAKVRANPPMKAAEILVTGAGIAYRKDGTDPTSTVGVTVSANGTISLEHPNDMSRFKAIRTGGSDALLRVEYLR